MVATQNAWVLAYDNLSSMPPWLSDLLCCISTGGSHTSRTKYSDTGETVMRAERPLLLMSIEDIASRSDLLDRTIVLTLPTIPNPPNGEPKSEYGMGLLKAHPRILGALLYRRRACVADVARCGAGRTASHVGLCALGHRCRARARAGRWGVSEGLQ